MIPLENENVTLSEAMAMTQLETPGNLTNIRLVREGKINQIDLNDINQAEWATLQIMPGDIIYLEPMPPTFGDKLRDASPLISLITAIMSITAIIISTSR